MKRTFFSVVACSQLMMPVAAQTVQVDPQAAREATAAGAVELEPDDASRAAAPLASGSRERVISRTEAENRTRAAQGRLGVKLGEDMSFRLGVRY